MIRLLHCGHWDMQEHSEAYQVPDYAILSHTWELPHHTGEAKDVNYNDVRSRIASEDPTKRPSATAQLKEAGWIKVEDARKEAWDLGFAWIWIDSCCINTLDPQEHTEAINSMYQWYQDSQVCIAFISDLQGKVLGRNRWFYRGWTLQELIAPPAVFFYNRQWEYCGSRNGRPRSLHQSTGSGEGYAYDENEDLSKKIAQITSIDESLLRKNDPGRIKRELARIPACQKMHWAWERETSRTEDMAYCLIGIFDINHFYLKRGERDGAFIRLQEEIIRQSSDTTLFAWRATNADRCVALNRLRSEDLHAEGPLFRQSRDLHGIFACRPSEFQYAKDIQSSQHVMYNDEIGVTSKGVKLTAALWGDGPTEPFTMSLNSYNKVSKAHLGIHLRWIGGNVYARTDIDALADLDIGRALPSQDDIFLLRKVQYVKDSAASLVDNAIHLPLHITDGPLSLQRVSVTPSMLWSDKMELFLTSGTKLPVGYASYCQVAQPWIVLTILFGLTYVDEPWSCLIHPNSVLAPSQHEMRKAYIDRVWRFVFQAQGLPAIFDDNGTFFDVKSTISRVSSQLDDRPRFFLGLQAIRMPESHNSVQNWTAQRQARLQFESAQRQVRSHSRISQREHARPTWAQEVASPANTAMRQVGISPAIRLGVGPRASSPETLYVIQVPSPPRIPSPPPQRKRPRVDQTEDHEQSWDAFLDEPEYDPRPHKQQSEERLQGIPEGNKVEGFVLD